MPYTDFDRACDAILYADPKNDEGIAEVITILTDIDSEILSALIGLSPSQDTHKSLTNIRASVRKALDRAKAIN